MFCFKFKIYSLLSAEKNLFFFNLIFLRNEDYLILTYRKKNETFNDFEDIGGFYDTTV